ncbi:MAG: hypothetical protein B7Y25_00800 [Alphaproteobacteria bacterium 16-39-46]|nr:MAG: hypothetical protein B7Y25_00800 [Alphaproteobacteria bacterium 16-39-46]OZA44298.1 MAG: hypothetical protein B7X84_01000 [Alphaproteobacteria bacterium 17-39-52]HQS84816.1 RT0821/Lpp0805 family surface protein [Alphaproteobacteria bacterium]HQS93231.1 RT0821/Lpp0805 family surface protein [Alphaproteobacteria bacterium]
MVSHKYVSVIAGIAVISTLSGCMTGGPKETGGTLLGGIGGAAIGSQFGKGTGQLVGVAAGTLLGAFIGNSIGSSLDKADQMYADKTAQKSFESAPSGQTQRWANPDSGHSGTITPTKTFQTQNGQYCREFTQTIEVGGKKQQGYGTACRQPDGSWQIVSNN